jgi:hypothetical protein
MTMLTLAACATALVSLVATKAVVDAARAKTAPVRVVGRRRLPAALTVIASLAVAVSGAAIAYSYA